MTCRVSPSASARPLKTQRRDNALPRSNPQAEMAAQATPMMAGLRKDVWTMSKERRGQCVDVTDTASKNTAKSRMGILAAGTQAGVFVPHQRHNVDHALDRGKSGSTPTATSVSPCSRLRAEKQKKPTRSGPARPRPLPDVRSPRRCQRSAAGADAAVKVSCGRFRHGIQERSCKTFLIGFSAGNGAPGCWASA